MIAQMEYVISIAKKYNHAKTHYKDPRNRGSKGAKPVFGIYYLNEEMKLRFRKISRLMIPYYHTRLWKRRVFVTYANGRSQRTRNFMFFHFYPRVEEGAFVTVPARPEGQELTDLLKSTVTTVMPIILTAIIIKSIK